MDVLLTFVGKRDPIWNDGKTSEKRNGPIVSLFSVRRFDRVELFYNDQTKQNALSTQEALQNLGVETNPRELPLSDPTDYITILRGLREHLRVILQDFPDATFFIAEASGTPQMQASWLLLAACGFINAKVLQVRPQEYVDEDHPLVSEVDFRSPEFPVVRPVYSTAESHKIPPAVIREATRKIGIIGEHPLIKRAIEIAAIASQSEKPVLILGESGTGKELFAKLVHELSGRSGRFIERNCAAIPETIAESELFGHVKGAFTGATQAHDGLFHEARGGTLFLDELAKLALPTQGKLLRAVEDKRVTRLGSRTAVDKIDVRLVAATNKLREALLSGELLEDLYYRLNVWEIEIPALRDRKSDVPLLALHFVDECNQQQNQTKRLSDQALKRLQNHDWKQGNVRELAKLIENACYYSPKIVLNADDMDPWIKDGGTDPYAWLPEPQEGFKVDDYLEEARKHLYNKALEKVGGHKWTAASKLLGISPTAVKKYTEKNLK